jgi:hypothetical protein
VPRRSLATTAEKLTEPLIDVASPPAWRDTLFRRARSFLANAFFESLSATVIDRLQSAQTELLVPVINGTGILLHTNLGRAPLAASNVPFPDSQWNDAVTGPGGASKRETLAGM